MILERKTPVKELLIKNGLNTQNRRWCTRIYKIQMAKVFYKFFGLGNRSLKTPFVQVKGMTQFQSPKRNKIFTKMFDTGDFTDPLSFSKGRPDPKFYAIQEFPIYNKTEEQLQQLRKSLGIKRNPVELIFWGEHGCMLCPYRKEEYFLHLKTWYPLLYQQLHKLRKFASQNMEGKEYFHFPNSKIM